MIHEQALSAQLRQATQALHLEAERSGYIAEILRKRASHEGYALLLHNLAPAYDALERGLTAHADHQALVAFDWPPLFRHQAMLNDLKAMATTSRQSPRTLLPESQAYAARIEKISREAPHRLLGHAYVRYIGDLSGGQIVKAILAASPGIGSEMLTFYDFDAIPNAEGFKDCFRGTLDQANDDPLIAEEIVDEALIAFQLNIDLSRAVHQALPATEG